MSKDDFLNEEFDPVVSGFTAAELRAIACGANSSGVFDPDFRSVFEVKKEAWENGSAPLSTSNRVSALEADRPVHLPPRKSIGKERTMPKLKMKKKSPKVSSGARSAERN